MTKPDNPPAFPLDPAISMSHHSVPDAYNGMTLRDWFAGQALAGLISNEGEDASTLDYDEAAEQAYVFADAMLAERSKPQ